MPTAPNSNDASWRDFLVDQAKSNDPLTATRARQLLCAEDHGHLFISGRCTRCGVANADYASPYQPGDPITFLDASKRYRVGRFVREVKSGPKFGMLELKLLGKSIFISPDAVKITAKAKVKAEARSSSTPSTHE